MIYSFLDFYNLITIQSLKDFLVDKSFYQSRKSSLKNNNETLTTISPKFLKKTVSRLMEPHKVKKKTHTTYY